MVIGIQTMMVWVYAAIGLIVILGFLLAAPYAGIYGNREPFNEEDHT